MFGKSKPPDAAKRLADRVKQVTAGVASDVQAAEPQRPVDRAPRQAVFRNATVTLDSGQRLAVALKDVSSAGARIEFFQRNTLPASFMLSEPTLKLHRRVRVVWQREGIAGLMFDD